MSRRSAAPSPSTCALAATRSTSPPPARKPLRQRPISNPTSSSSTSACQVSIIVLSVREREADKVAALDAGADDFVTKPFGINELLARLRAAVRRATSTGEQVPIVHTPDFRVDLAAKQVVRDGKEVRLTPTEWQLVELLVRNPGRLVSQRQLLHEVWGPKYRDETNYLRVFIAQIRRKLEPDPAHPRYFITEPGMGYRYQP